jgi:hypothetical protein
MASLEHSDFAAMADVSRVLSTYAEHGTFCDCAVSTQHSDFHSIVGRRAASTGSTLHCIKLATGAGFGFCDMFRAEKLEEPQT